MGRVSAGIPVRAGRLFVEESAMSGRRRRGRSVEPAWARPAGTDGPPPG